MARLVVWILIAVMLLGGTAWLAGRDASQPVTRIEKAIPVDAPPR